MPMRNFLNPKLFSEAGNSVFLKNSHFRVCFNHCDPLDRS